MEPDASILAVDDNPGKLLAVEAALAPLGVRVVKATSGREALRCLLREQFAAVLLDVYMPGMDGFETAELIRGRPSSAHTPILFISAIHQTDEHAFRGYGLGAVDYIYAPSPPEVLRAKVSVFVELHRQTREAMRQAERVAEQARELRESHDRLRLAERMAAIGTLSAGLGHDLGNLLLPIESRLDKMAHKDVSAEAGEDIRAIRACTEYLRRLSSGLRLLAVDPEQASKGEATVLAPWWEEVSPLLRNALPKGVRIEQEFVEDLPPVGMARAAVTQAVFNLVQNAGDAMRDHGGGLVRVTARAESARTILLEVRDTGPGMSEEVARRCLDPFFTTKTRSFSTGLGLALVHSLVTKAGGTIEVSSRPGAGTTFRLMLPAGEAPAAIGAPARRGVAVVTLKDARVAAYAAAVLKSLEYEVRLGRAPSGASLWLADAQHGTVEQVRRFVRSDVQRHAVLIGARGVKSDRVTCLEASGKPSRIREALLSIVNGRRSARGPTKTG